MENNVTIDDILRVLIRQVGDHRMCPYCHKAFLPDDDTAKLAYNLHKLLEKKQ